MKTHFKAENQNLRDTLLWNEISTRFHSHRLCLESPKKPSGILEQQTWILGYWTVGIRLLPQLK